MPEVLRNSTSKSIEFRVVDDETGLPKTDLNAASAGLSIQYRIDNGSKVSITPSDLAAINSAYSSGGLKHVGAGKYRLDSPNSCWLDTGLEVKFYGEADDCVFYFHDYQIVPPNISGNGRIQQQLEITDGDDEPIEDVRVWISTDIGGTNIVAGPLYTDEFGLVTFFLSAATYYRWCSKTGVTFTNPQSFTVT